MARRVRIEDIWPDLKEGTLQVLSSSKTPINRKQWMVLYTLVHDYCSSPHQDTDASRSSLFGSNPTGAQLKGQAVYERVSDLLRQYLREVLAQMEQSAVSGDLLSFYTKSWEQYLLGASRIDRLYDYVNRHWVPRERGDKNLDIYDINTLCLVSWKAHLFQEVKGRLLHSILVMVEKERKGEQVDRSVLSVVIKSFVRLGVDQERLKEPNLLVYQSDFEAALLSHTEAFYLAESAEFVATNSCVDYMKKVEGCLERELERVRNYLDSSSEAKLLGVCENVLLTRQKDMLWAEFPILLKDNRQDDLKRMYKLLYRAHLLDPLRGVLEQHITSEGLKAIEKIEQNGNDPAVYIDALLSVYRQYHEMIRICFDDDSSLSSALDKACRTYMNENSITKVSNASKTPELLAKHCDSILRKGLKALDDTETETALSNIMVVFKYIEDKDVFQKFYSRKLSHRLISGTSASDDAESSMIDKLKKECGYEYISKLQRMFSDMSVCRSLNAEFQDHLRGRSGDTVTLDFSVQVLTSNSWPLSPPPTNFNIPSELEKALTVFQEYYQTRFTGKKLTWLHQHSKAELKTQYLIQSKTFVVSTYQMGILMHYNLADTATYEELQIVTGLSEVPLKSTLETIVEAQILTCSEKVEDGNFNKSHRFSLNLQYTNKRQKVVINTAIKAEQKQEAEQTHKFVDEDRKLQIQAAIVRIMKARKQLNHNSLIQEVITQLQSRFKPKIPVIKSSIETLLEREYIERASNTTDVYNYVA